MNTKRTTTFLMANLGSEMVRLFNLKRQGRIDDAKASAARAVILIDSIVSRPDIGQGAKEAEILRGIVKDVAETSPRYSVSEKELNSYFAPFALRAL